MVPTFPRKCSGSPYNRIKYSIAPAEHQPFDDNTFDLITVGSGVHWFNIDHFLVEANRLLKSRAWLILYENHFIAEMEGHEDFKTWFYDVYLKKFPYPPRHKDYSRANENLDPKNFDFVKEEKFKNPVSMTRRKLALYFTTQSNVIAAVENNSITYEEADQWLERELVSFYKDDSLSYTIHYGNWIRYVRKSD